MRLLIITQVVDRTHPILGFFHTWLAAFAEHCDQVEVICLFAGEHELPENVTVHSLGKEQGVVPTWRYTLRFMRLIWQLRQRYDGVFVHMNPEYVLLAGWYWRLTQCRIGLWYTHGTASWRLRIASWFAQDIFVAAAKGNNLRSRKVRVTGHGITVLDVPAVTKTRDLITVGRVSRAKNLLALVKVLQIIRQTHPTARLTIVGDTVLPEHETYKAEVLAEIEARQLTDAIEWTGSVAPAEVPQLLASARVFVHAAENGSLDKALLEAAALGLPVISSAPGAASMPLGDWQVPNTAVMAERVEDELHTPNSERANSLQQWVVDTHSLRSLIPRLVAYYDV